MIMHNTETDVNTNMASSSFSIEMNGTMFSMLSKNVYNDVILAPIREWSTNAIDACIDAGNPIHFDVFLPTAEDQQFNVRDYGTGLTEDQITNLFATFGASTKRDSNEFNGTFGIGRMSALAYTNQFSIESFKDGKHITYLVTTKNSIPQMIHLGTTDTTEENGLKLTLPVRTEDIKHFKEKAEYLYKYFEHKPNTNIELNLDKNVKIDISEDWLIDESLNYRTNYILMSNILYKIPDDSQVKDHGFRSAVIKVPTGAVSINPGRESLSMDKETIATINAKFDKMAEEYVEYSATAVTALTKPYDQVLAYSAGLNSCPYSLKDAFRTGVAPIIANWIGWHGRKLKFYDYDISFSLKYRYRKTLQTADDISVENLNRLKFLLVDQKTNWKHVLETISDDYTIILSRPKGVDFDHYLTAANTWLTTFGCTYHKTSEWEQPENTKEAIVARNGIYVGDVYSYGMGSTNKIDPDTNYFYLPATGAKIDEGHDIALLRKAFDVFRRQLPEEDYCKYRLVGVPKKYQDDAASHPNFIKAKEGLIARLNGLEIPITSDNYDSICIDRLKLDHYPNIKIPESIKTYYNEYIDYSRNYRNNAQNQYDVEAIKEEFGVIPKRFEYTVAQGDLHKYKLLDNLLYKANLEDVLYYLELEAYKEEH